MASRAGGGPRSRLGRGAALTRLLFDTTFLIDTERAGNQLERAIDDDDDAAVAAITVTELKVGVELSRGRAKIRRQAYLDDILATIPVIDYNVDVSESHAQLLVVVRQQGRPRGAHDLMIAATASASGRTVLTADRTAFTDLPGISFRLHR
jgi:tRNA(fMet)-specific endonuclease VapC